MKLNQIIGVILLVVALVVIWSVTRALLPFLWATALIFATLALLAFLIEWGGRKRS